jgi:hypothetical protein
MVNEKVPENFSAEINNGKLSVVGLPQPYVFKDEEKNNFVAVIDTVSTSSLSLRNYLTVAGQSGVLIDSEKIEILNGQNMQGQVQYWKDVKESNFRLDKPLLVSVLNKTGPVFVIIIFLVVLVALFVAFVIGKLFSILMVTLILLVVTAIARRSWRAGLEEVLLGGGDVFGVGLHGGSVVAHKSYRLASRASSRPRKRISRQHVTLRSRRSGACQSSHLLQSRAPEGHVPLERPTLGGVHGATDEAGGVGLLAACKAIVGLDDELCREHGAGHADHEERVRVERVEGGGGLGGVHGEPQATVAPLKGSEPCR